METVIYNNYHDIPYNKEEIFNEKINDDFKCLNDVRKQLLVQSSNTLKNELNNGNKVFMLNIPTGGGKTNVSLKLALDILKYYNKINRINWVFPFINIVEQSYNVINHFYFKGENNYVKKIYSNLIQNKEFYENEDVFIENKKQINIDDLEINHINNLINVISTVNFLNMLFKVGKNNRYKFSNFTNSIIIIDEIQSLSGSYINLFYNIVKQLSE